MYFCMGPLYEIRFLCSLCGRFGKLDKTWQKKVDCLLIIVAQDFLIPVPVSILGFEMLTCFFCFIFRMPNLFVL